MNEYIKPPIGVSPHWYIHNKRIKELSEAITRYSDFIMRYVNVKDERDCYKSIAKWAYEIKKLAEIEIQLLIADKQEVKIMNKEQQIEEMMLTVPQKIVAYDGNPAGQHLYGEQRQQIAETLYNAGYRKVPKYAVIIPAEEREAEMKATNEILAERDGLKAEIERLKAVLEIKQKQAVKEFAERLKDLLYTVYGKHGAPLGDLTAEDIACEIDELLKEYEG